MIEVDLICAIRICITHLSPSSLFLLLLSAPTSRPFVGIFLFASFVPRPKDAFFAQEKLLRSAHAEKLYA